MNERLIASLQALRDNYTVKQKATNTFMSTLKGKSSAWLKVQQAVQGYATDSGHPDQLSALQNHMTAAQDQLTPLLTQANRELKTLTALNGALKAIQSALASTPVDVVKLSTPLTTLKSLDIQDEHIVALLPDLTQELDKAQQALAVDFGSALRQAFGQLGITVSGTPPKFEVQRFELSANFIMRNAAISYGKEIVQKKIPLSIDAVIKAYQSASKMIVGREEAAEVWMSQFYLAWQTARQKKDATNPRVNIIDCYFEMVLQRQSKTFFSLPTKSAFSDYSRAQFAYDLQEIAIRPHRTYKGLTVFAHVATKSQTENQGKCLWVVDGAAPHDGRYIGDIVFDKDE